MAANSVKTRPRGLTLPPQTPQKFGGLLSIPGQDPGVPVPRTPGTPVGASVWAAQNQSSAQASSGYLLSQTSGIKTPSGYEFLDLGSTDEIQRLPRSFEWEWWSDWSTAKTPELSPSGSNFDSPSPSKSSQSDHVGEILKRRLGPNEISYYLSSRGAGPEDPIAGVNDMYLHIGFSAQPSLMSRERVEKIWTELRLRHTLLASTVEYESMEDVRFVFKPYTTFKSARAEAAENISFRYNTTKDQVLDDYLNGSRTLDDNKLAALIISSPEPELALTSLALEEGEEKSQRYDFFILATHFLGDGMALHTTANEFFDLLGGKLEACEKENSGLEWDVSTGQIKLPNLARLPPAQESRIITPESYGRLAWAAARVDFARNQAQTIGGQTFPRAKLGSRKTTVPTHSFTPAETSAILKKCKANGVTIAHAMFALSNLAHIRVTAKKENELTWKGGLDKSLPMMLYSALNLRPNMAKGPEEDQGVKPDFFHLVIGYYNVILPAFAPKGLTGEQLFWRRARETKTQTLKAIKTPFLCQRSKLMSLERERRAIGFEKEDERRRREKAAKQSTTILNSAPVKAAGDFVQEIVMKVVGEPEVKVAEQEKRTPVAPSLAFLGVSMLGNLDGMYKHASFDRIKLEELTTGSRQRPGAMLMFAYTFAGKLFVSLGYDTNGYPEGVVEEYYEEMLTCVREFLM